MKKATKIVAISNSILKKNNSIFSENRLVMIHNGIDSETYHFPDKKIFENSMLTFTIIGGILPYKGQKEFLTACGEVLKEGFENFNIQIIGKGKGDYLAQIRGLIDEYNLGNHITVFEPRKDVPKLLEKTDILFVCSKNEAFGRVTVEGMMAGCLVIGADTSGTLELIQDGKTGFLYRQGDAVSLKEVIFKAVKNYSFSMEVAKTGQEQAIKMFSATRNAEEIINLYKEILKKEV
jgi:glycosyltransferase involved in cell wall biosynthesis